MSKTLQFEVYYCRDIGSMDREGYLRLKGRKSDGIRFKRSGDVLYPQPVEEAVKSHANIHDAMVILRKASGNFKRNVNPFKLKRRLMHLTELAY